jgi:hypothetical protein
MGKLQAEWPYMTWPFAVVDVTVVIGAYVTAAQPTNDPACGMRVYETEIR